MSVFYTKQKSEKIIVCEAYIYTKLSKLRKSCMDKYSNITKIKLLAAKEREAIHRWHELSSNAEVKNIEYSQNCIFNPLSANPTSGQVFWVCLTILWGFALKG